MHDVHDRILYPEARGPLFFCGTGLLMLVCKNHPLVTQHFWLENTVQGGASSAVRAQCNYLGVWRY